MKNFTTTQNNTREKREDFSLKDRVESVAHAWRGISIFFKRTHNARVHVFFALLALVLGFIFSISSIEWAVIILTIGLVFTAEALNTAIEIDIDLTSPEPHPYARDTKDVAAGAVLLSSIMAIIIGLIIFLPYIIRLL